jgi:hypothetical protein
MSPLIVTDEAYPYLVLQQGRLDHLKQGRQYWEAAYNAKVEAVFSAIAPHLPERCRAFMDVGGGVGGMAALLARHFPDSRVGVLDGAADPAVMVRHAQTFNDLAVTGGFLLANGVRRPRLMMCPAQDPGTPKPLDLVVSFGSWCFHYPPASYLEWVKACCHTGTRLILEVRRGHYDWQAQLADVFDPIATCGESDKWIRVVYAAR